MPLYSYACNVCGNVEDHYRKVDQRDEAPLCHDMPMHRIVSAPMIFAARDIHYDSPIDGRAITSKQARIEDLARSGCVEYDPGVKQDYERRRQRGERDLEQKVDEHVEREIETMPTRKREKLAAELEGGAEAQIVRTSFKETSNA